MFRIFIALIFLSSVHPLLAVNLDSLIQLATTSKVDSVRMKACSDLCFELRLTDQKAAFDYGFKALDIAQNSKNKKGEAQAYNDISIIHIMRSEYEKAIEMLEKSRLIREELKDDLGIATIYNKMGIINQQMGDYNKAIEVQMKALELFDKIDHKYGVTQSNNNLAVLYMNQANYKKALEYHLVTKKMRIEINDSIGYAVTIMNIGNVYQFEGNVVESEKYYNEALLLFRRYINQGTKEYIPAVLNNLVNIYLVKQDYEKCKALLKESIELRQSLNDLKGLASCYNNFGKVLIEEKKPDEALIYLNKALEIGKQINSKVETQYAYDKLYRIYKEKGNLSKALEYFEIAKALSDSLLNEANIVSMNEMEAKYQNEKKKTEISLLKTETELKDLQIFREKSIRNVVIIILFLIVIMSVIVFFFIRNRQKTQRIIEVQKERERIARDLHDNIGSHLTYIITNVEDVADELEGDKKEQLENLAVFARETITQLRQTIWAISKSKINLVDFEAKAKDLLTQFFVSPNAPKFDVNFKAIKNIVLSPVQALNIFRIIQEAIHNIIKHSKAKNVWIVITYDQQLIVKVIDDGVGFDMKTEKPDHYGLQNMKKRANEINGALRLVSEPQKGTIVEFSMDI